MWMNSCQKKLRRTPPHSGKLEQNKNCLQMLKAMDEPDEAYIQRVAGKINEIKARLEAAQPVSQRLSALETFQNQRNVIRSSKNKKIDKRKTYIQNLLDEQTKWEGEVKDLDAEIAEDGRKIQIVKLEAGQAVAAEGKPIYEPSTLALIEAMPQDEKDLVLQKKLEFEQALASRKPGQLNSSGSQAPVLFAPRRTRMRTITFKSWYSRNSTQTKLFHNSKNSPLNGYQLTRRTLRYGRRPSTLTTLSRPETR